MAFGQKAKRIFLQPWPSAPEVGEGEAPIIPKGKPKSAGVEGPSQEEVLPDGSGQAPAHILAAEDEGTGPAERKLAKDCAGTWRRRRRQEEQCRAGNLKRRQENKNEHKQRECK
ncbi:hypothetical protein D623_10014253 [Myotis brandtii]|uniref:Uncharacterized protein n=1 Tax=Myotis brandtii TaxID=109478 RepID=S7Q9P6_MYOBR|nr:hypothetical protein D623_10014253 [Myotis brandtii]